MCYNKIAKTQNRKEEKTLNARKLKARLVELGKTMKQLADYLGMNITTLSRKVNGQSEFTRSEIEKTCEFLELETPLEIFFDDYIA